MSKKGPPPGLMVVVDDNDASDIRTLEVDLAYYGIDEATANGIRVIKTNMKKADEAKKQVLMDIFKTCSMRETPRKVFKTISGIKSSHWTQANGVIVDVCVSKFEDDKWLKIYRCVKTDDTKNVVESEFAFEVYYQKKATDFNESCGFISPNIHDYGWFDDDDYYYHYIIMDFIPEAEMTKEQCNGVKESVYKLDVCLNSNGIYHNDIAPRNVRVRGDTIETILFDFGEARNKPRGKHKNWNCGRVADSTVKDVHLGEASEWYLNESLLDMDAEDERRKVTPSPPKGKKGGMRTIKRRIRKHKKRKYSKKRK